MKGWKLLFKIIARKVADGEKNVAIMPASLSDVKALLNTVLQDILLKFEDLEKLMFFINSLNDLGKNKFAIHTVVELKKVWFVSSSASLPFRFLLHLVVENLFLNSISCTILHPNIKYQLHFLT